MTKVGLGFRHAMKSGILEHPSELDCLEITTEHYIPLTASKLAELHELRAAFPLIPHGLSLSIGAVDRPPQTYLDAIARVLEAIDPPYYSDHFAFTGTSAVQLGHLSPLWYTEQALEVVINNIEEIQRFLGLPLVLETITRPFNVPNPDMTEAAFIRRASEATACGILLDITNVYINAGNFASDPYAFVSDLPAKAIRQFHLVGYTVDSNGTLIDSHSSPVQPELWDLYDRALGYANPEYVIIERDTNYPGPAEWMSELQRARSSGKRGCFS